MLAATLADPATIGRTFELMSGSDQIEAALAKLAELADGEDLERLRAVGVATVT